MESHCGSDSYDQMHDLAINGGALPVLDGVLMNFDHIWLEAPHHWWHIRISLGIVCLKNGAPSMKSKILCSKI